MYSFVLPNFVTVSFSCKIETKYIYTLPVLVALRTFSPSVIINQITLDWKEAPA